MKIHKFQVTHERSVIQAEDPTVDFDFSNIKDAYVVQTSSTYPAPVLPSSTGITDEEFERLFNIHFDDIYDMDLGIEYDFGIGGDIVAMVTNDGELIEMYDNPIDATVETPDELKDTIYVDSYEELSNKINGELLSEAFDDLQTETRLER